MAWYRDSWTYGWEPSLDDPYLDLLLYKAAKEKTKEERQFKQTMRDLDRSMAEDRQRRIWKEQAEIERQRRPMTDEELAKEIRRNRYWKARAERDLQEKLDQQAYEDKMKQKEFKSARQALDDKLRRDLFYPRLIDNEGFHQRLSQPTQEEFEMMLALGEEADQIDLSTEDSDKEC